MNHTVINRDQKIRIIILGSCISRDIFFSYPDNFNIVDYFARTSIKSLISTPLFITEGDLNLPSAFQKRMVARDFSKYFWERLKIHDYDFVLMDLIDERFDLIEYGGSFITKSSELDNSGYLNDKAESSKIIPKKNYDIGQWGEDLITFMTKMKECVRPNRILLLKAFWASNYMDKKGSTSTFSSQIGVDRINKQLSEYYRSITELNPGIRLIDTPQPLADEGHRWGLTPYHYCDGWYLESKKRIHEQVNTLLGHQ